MCRAYLTFYYRVTGHRESLLEPPSRSRLIMLGKHHDRSQHRGPVYTRHEGVAEIFSED